MVRLGQAEAADDRAGRETRQELLTLRLRAELVDRRHDQRRLHAEHGAVAGIDALELARDQTVAGLVDAGAAVALDGRAEQAELAHLVEDAALDQLVAIRLEDARHQAFLRVLAGGGPDQPLVVGELLLEEERVVPGERGLVSGRRRSNHLQRR